MSPLRPLLSLLFMLLALAVAHGLDRWVFIQQRAARASFEYGSLLLALIVSALLLVASWVLLAWWTLVRPGRWVVSLVFLLVGLLIVLYPPLRVLSGWAVFRPLPLFSLDDRLTFTGAFLAALGALSWLLAGTTRSRDE